MVLECWTSSLPVKIANCKAIDDSNTPQWFVQELKLNYIYLRGINGHSDVSTS